MDAPPPVVFVPGFMQRGDGWRAVADAVSERYPSARLDLAGGDFDDRVAQVLRAAGSGAALVGYSMGGRLALHAALRDPGRVAALVLVGTNAGIENDAERAERRAADERLADWIESQPIEAVVERWEENPVFATQPRWLVDAQRPGRLSHEPVELAQLLRTGGQGVLDPVWDRLGALAMPLLALAGREDERYVEAARRIGELALAGEWALAPGGHAPQLEHPEAVAELVLEFLDRHFGDGRR